mmetsp:Transcript_12448/g.24183  ORF Transcript_12448/g.24183 Transcript_12448/m.24183 type:complete len:185 (+) Transcript_12448:184-738(+)
MHKERSEGHEARRHTYCRAKRLLSSLFCGKSGATVMPGNLSIKTLRPTVGMFDAWEKSCIVRGVLWTFHLPCLAVLFHASCMAHKATHTNPALMSYLCIAEFLQLHNVGHKPTQACSVLMPCYCVTLSAWKEDALYFNEKKAVLNDRLKILNGSACTCSRDAPPSCGDAAAAALETNRSTHSLA